MSAVVFRLHCCHVCHFLPLHLYLKKSNAHLQRCVSLEMLIYVHWWQLLLFSFLFLFIGSPIPLPTATQSLRNTFPSFSGFSLKSSKPFVRQPHSRKLAKNSVFCFKKKKTKQAKSQSKSTETTDNVNKHGTIAFFCKSNKGNLEFPSRQG